MKMDVKSARTVETVNVVNKIKQSLRDFYLIYFSKKMSKDDAVRLIINKELKRYKVDIDYVKDNPTIGGERWYEYYTFNSEEEYEKWEKFSKRILRKVFPYSDKKFIDNEFSYLNLAYGLRCKYGNKNNK